jgi:AcrR family transcriptional regulator
MVAAGVPGRRLTETAHAVVADRQARIRPTSERGRRTRAALVNAARRVFLDVGYAEANATAITKVAGVSYGSFYVYFTSKEELFREIAGELMEEVFVSSRAPRSIVDAVERLEYENRRFFELYRENARMFQLIDEAVRSEPDFRTEWQQLRRANFARLARALARLQREGRIESTPTPDYLARALGGMAERLAYVSTVDDALDPEELLATLNVVWRRSLGLGSDG